MMKTPIYLNLILLSAVLAGAACAPRYMPPEPPPPAPPPPPAFEPIWVPAVDIMPELEPEVPTAEELVIIRGALHLIDLSAFDMPIHVNEHVLGYIDVFTGRARGRFAEWLSRQGRYVDIIEARIAERGMPRELIYLALIESGYSPVAVSHANAVGLWQFIAATGRLEGLVIDEFVDERRDPVRATDAALQHLQRLYDRFGSWYLAAAAYNAGSGRIDRALALGADGRRGSDSLFWEIRSLLPAETRNYVPQLIAASIVGAHRHVFGFQDVVPAPPLLYESVTIPDATEFAVIAEAAGVDPRVIAEYNTVFTQRMTPPGRRVELRLPPGRAEAFATAYAAIPADQRVRTLVHRVAAGETLSGIARRYGTSVAAIQAANRIDRPDRIAVGTRLIVPTSAAAAAVAATAAASGTRAGAAAPGRTGGAAGTPAATTAGATTTARATTTAPAADARRNAATTQSYTVRTGDTLIGIARRHDLTLEQLTTLNGIRPTATIRPGQTLKVRVVTVYQVQAGDTLSAIARQHGVSTRQLIEWNALQSEVIRPGDRLEVR